MPICYCMYHLLQHTKTVPTEYICVIRTDLTANSGVPLNSINRLVLVART
jgi:hypothetical protein